MYEGLTVREKAILELIIDDAELTVSKISEMLDVSGVTVRSNLASLEEKGVIVRTHGGALPAFHPSVLDRLRNQSEVKKRIAKAAAELVTDGSTIMIEAGTTTALIAKYLMGKRDIHIVTDSTLILPYVRVNPAVSVTLIGGEFRAASEAVVGAFATRQLADFYVDIAFVGTDGFSIEKGLASDLVESGEIVKTMYENSRQTVLVADSAKYGRIGFTRVLPLNKLDLIISDSGLSSDVIELMDEEKINIKVV